MTLTVNGSAVDVPAGATVAALLARLGHDRAGRGMAVAVNGEVVPRSQWATTELAESDRVEVVAATQGG